MKITDITGTQSIEINTDYSKSKAVVKGAGFSDVFDDELIPESPAQTASVESPLAPAALADVSDVAATEATAGGESEIADSVEIAMEQLETVGQSLQDGSVTPKSIDKTIDNLSKNVQGLQEKLQTLPEDHPLRVIGTELSVLASTESIKWKRGDYL